ncbi:MAG TPA: O-antigen ligase domain-containing protein [Alphaproteobacteria bacterium]|nr:O-antigen ligase domain-containing protein [Alphaproteobacteria bacterium]
MAFSTVTASRGGFVGMGFSLLAWLFLGLRYPPKRLFVGVGAVVAMILLVNSTYPFYVSDPGFDGEVSIGEFVSHTTRKMVAEPDTGRLRTYTEAAKNIMKAPLTGVGAGKPSHSLFLGAGQEGGILMMALWTILFAVLVVRSYRMWLTFRCHPYWGPVTLGLSISMAYAFIQNWLDGMLYAVGYGLVFWLLRGVESVLSAEKAQVNFPVALSIQKNEETPA